MEMTQYVVLLQNKQRKLLIGRIKVGICCHQSAIITKDRMSLSKKKKTALKLIIILN